MRLLLGVRSKNEKANAPKQLTFFRKKLLFGFVVDVSHFWGIDSPMNF